MFVSPNPRTFFLVLVSTSTFRCFTVFHQYTTLVDAKKRTIKKLFTHAESHASSASLLETWEQHYIKAINKFSALLLYNILARSFPAVSATCLHRSHWCTSFCRSASDGLHLSAPEKVALLQALWTTSMEIPGLHPSPPGGHEQIVRLTDR